MTDSESQEYLKRKRDNNSKQQQKTDAEKLKARQEKNERIKKRSLRAKMRYYDPEQNVVEMSVKHKSKSETGIITSAVIAMFENMYTANDPEKE